MSSFSPHRVIVADDDHDTADSTADLLRLDDHDVRSVYDGLQAVEMAKTFRPHLVILDIQMPVMDGCEAAGALRRQSADSELVLIAHTSLTQRADLERVRRAGFDHHVSKPAGHRELEALVAKCRQARAKS